MKQAFRNVLPVPLLWITLVASAPAMGKDLFLGEPYDPNPDLETIGSTTVNWLESLGFKEVELRAQEGYTLMLTGYFPCPKIPPKGWQPLCPDHQAGFTVPHELLVDTLPMSVVITTLGKNHPLGPWLVQGWPGELREPYDIANPALPGQCINPRP